MKIHDKATERELLDQDQMMIGFLARLAAEFGGCSRLTDSEADKALLAGFDRVMLLYTTRLEQFRRGDRYSPIVVCPFDGGVVEAVEASAKLWSRPLERPSSESELVLDAARVLNHVFRPFLLEWRTWRANPGRQGQAEGRFRDAADALGKRLDDLDRSAGA